MGVYPKIENLYARDPETNRLTRELRLPEFGQISKWLVTEKIDGTNVRLELLYLASRLHHGEVRGRSDAATLPKTFVEEALGHLPHGDLTSALLRALEAIMPSKDPEDPLWGMTVYGEGYGPGIQKGGDLAKKKKSLAVFDVATYRLTDRSPEYGTLDIENRFVRSRPLWRTWEDVETVAAVLGLATVSVLDRSCDLQTIVEEVDEGFSSVFGADQGKDVEAEGVVARTDPYLFNFRGHRVAFKLKTRDLAAARTAERADSTAS